MADQTPTTADRARRVLLDAFMAASSTAEARKAPDDFRGHAVRLRFSEASGEHRSPPDVLHLDCVAHSGEERQGLDRHVPHTRGHAISADHDGPSVLGVPTDHREHLACRDDLGTEPDALTGYLK